MFLLFQEKLVLELETLKEMRIGMDCCLEMMQFIRKDLETMAENLETLEGIVYYCQAFNVILICHNAWHYGQEMQPTRWVVVGSHTLPNLNSGQCI
jgi:hypothetical protein